MLIVLQNSLKMSQKVPQGSTFSPFMRTAETLIYSNSVNYSVAVPSCSSVYRFEQGRLDTTCNCRDGAQLERKERGGLETEFPTHFLKQRPLR